MGNAVKINFKELENFSKQLEKLAEETRWVIAELANEIAARLLRKVIKRTPVGKKPFGKDVKKTVNVKVGKKRRAFLTREGAILEQHWSGYVGGTLRRGWDLGPITKSGETYSVEVFNSVEYASYVEYGHRQTPGKFVPQIGKKLKKGWVQGQFMLTISEKEIGENLEVIIERKLTELFRERFR